jgi:hypothetical protein
MNKTVDIYTPLDAREAPNKKVWPVALPQIDHLVKIAKKCGFTPNVMTPEWPVSSVAEGFQREPHVPAPS